MLFKMLAKERSWAEFFQESTAKPRQLFVTQSQVLARNVQEYFARLTQAFATAGLSPKELRMIAATSQTKRAEALGSRMVNEDEEIHVYWNGTLPRRYGELKDSDFPMFLTYDHVGSNFRIFHVVPDVRCANRDTDLLEVAKIHTATERFERANSST